MPYWIGFQVRDGSRHVDLQSFDSYEEAMRHRDNLKRQEPIKGIVSSPFQAETKEEAKEQVKYYMIGLQDS